MSMHTDRKSSVFGASTAALFLLFSVLLHASEVEARGLIPIAMTPSHPMQGEVIMFNYQVGVCSGPLGGMDVNVDGSIISVDMIPPEVCIPAPYEAEFQLPGLAAGEYQLRTYRLLSNSDFPADPSERTLLHTFDFEVRGLQAQSVDSLGLWSKGTLALLLILTVFLFELYGRRTI